MIPAKISNEEMKCEMDSSEDDNDYELEEESNEESDSDMREELDEQGIDGEEMSEEAKVIPVEKMLGDRFKSLVCREQFTFIK